MAPDVLERTFEAGRPNHPRVADFTYVWTSEGSLYVAVVLNLFSLRIVGWSMKSQITADLVTDALVMAIWRSGPGAELLHHSDQGSHYTGGSFQGLLRACGIECSMSRGRDCLDNAVMESFFSSMKTERIDRRAYRTRDDARAEGFEYIERFYNPRRRHSTLGYLSPIDYENQARLA